MSLVALILSLSKIAVMEMIILLYDHKRCFSLEILRVQIDHLCYINHKINRIDSTSKQPIYFHYLIIIIFRKSLQKKAADQLLH